MTTTYNILGNRNPVLEIMRNDLTYRIQTIGDPHLGKLFKTGVPRDRLGSREIHVLNSFKEYLNKENIDLYVVLGDLFDKIQISNEVLTQAILILEESCNNNLDKSYYVLSGNHDLSKDVSKVSSFVLLERYFSNSGNTPNLHFITDSSDFKVLENLSTLLYFSNYDPFDSVYNPFTNDSISDEYNLSIAFGHWDTVDYGSSKFKSHQLSEDFVSNFDLVVTGHEHKPTQKDIQNTTVVVSGSLQPYAFGEDIREDGNLYVSLNIDEISKILEKNPKAFVNSNVRVFYKISQPLIEPFDCYSLSYKLIDDKPIEVGLTQEQLMEGAVSSFQTLILDVLKSRSSEHNQQYISLYEQVFLDKSYNESN